MVKNGDGGSSLANVSMRSKAVCIAACSGLMIGRSNWCGKNSTVSEIRLSWTITFVPGGARGVRLKSNAPFICASADRCGFSQEGLRRFNVNRACGSRQFQSCNGNCGFKVQSPAMK
eukprot:10936085-Ditylum_brightwellii.AAC.1